MTTRRTRTFARHAARGLTLAAAGLLVACGTMVPSARAQQIGKPVFQTAVEAPAETEVPAEGAAAAEPAPLPAEPVNLAPTPAQTEGPYFKAGSPERVSLLEPGMAGTPLVITGRVLTVDGAAVAGAKLDFWQADDRGQYDNAGYRLRGHLFTDENGWYRLETILPGLYPGRTRHIHVKAQAPGGRVLTSQLYLPDEAGNARDGIYNPALLMTVQERTAERVAASFDFVLGA